MILPAKLANQAQIITLYRCTNGRMILWLWIHVGMDEMYEIAQPDKYKHFGVSEMYKICDG